MQTVASLALNINCYKLLYTSAYNIFLNFLNPK